MGLGLIMEVAGIAFSSTMMTLLERCVRFFVRRAMPYLATLMKSPLCLNEQRRMLKANCPTLFLRHGFKENCSQTTNRKILCSSMRKVLIFLPLKLGAQRVDPKQGADGSVRQKEKITNVDRLVERKIRLASIGEECSGQPPTIGFGTRPSATSRIASHIALFSACSCAGASSSARRRIAAASPKVMR